MKELRNNLDSLKDDYASLKYPGDLASDVPLEPHWPMLLRIAPALALAAAVAVAATVWVMTRSAEPIVSPDRGVAQLPAEKQTDKTVDDLLNSGEGSDESSSEEDELLASMPEPETHTINAPSWSGIASGGFSASMVSMPAQSLSIPSVTEIDSALATSSTNSDI